MRYRLQIILSNFIFKLFIDMFKKEIENRDSANHFKMQRQTLGKELKIYRIITFSVPVLINPGEI